MTVPYYQDELVTLYHGDCREITEWLAADILVTDPPYGRAWRQGQIKAKGARTAVSSSHEGIKGDLDTTVRDTALAAWTDARLAIVFGDLMLSPPAGNRQTLVYRKPPDAGTRGATAGRRRDLEAVYLLGPWPSGIAGAGSSLLTTGARNVGNPSGLAARAGHPHAKPLDVLQDLICMAPPGTLADPFSGSGSLGVAAKLTGRPAVLVEMDERYCEKAANRLAQGALPFDDVA